MRGEPNGVGIRTKWSPHSNDAAYFFYWRDWMPDEGKKLKAMIDEDFAQIPDGCTVVIPLEGLGTGRAKLHQHCIDLLQYINLKVRELEA